MKSIRLLLTRGLRMNESSGNAARELAMSLLGVSDSEPATIRKWLAKCEFQTSNDEALAVRILAGRSADEDRFIWSQERRTAARVDTFAQKCIRLNSAERHARRQELLAELDSISPSALKFPRLASRRKMLERVLAIELPQEQLSSVTPSTAVLAERMLRLSLQKPKHQAVSRRALLSEAQTNATEWSKDAALLNKHFVDVAELDPSLVEELKNAPSLQRRQRMANAFAACEKLAAPAKFVGVMIGLAMLLVYVFAYRAELTTPRSNNRSTTSKKSKQTLPVQNVVTTLMVRADQLEKTLEDDASIADAVELSGCYLRLAVSEELSALLIMQGYKPNQIKQTYLKRARSVLPKQYRPRTNPITVEDFLAACQNIAADQDDEAEEVLLQAVEIAKSIQDKKSSTETQLVTRFQRIGQIYAELASRKEGDSSSYQKRRYIEEAVDWQTRSIVEHPSAAVFATDLFASVDQFVLLAEEGGFRDDVPDFLIRLRREFENTPSSERQQRKRILLKLAKEFARLHSRRENDLPTDEDDAQLEDEPDAQKQLVDEVVVTLKLIDNWRRGDLPKLLRDADFESIRSEPEFRRTLITLINREKKRVNDGPEEESP